MSQEMSQERQNIQHAIRHIKAHVGRDKLNTTLINNAIKVLKDGLKKEYSDAEKVEMHGAIELGNSLMGNQSGPASSFRVASSLRVASSSGDASGPVASSSSAAAAASSAEQTVHPFDLLRDPLRYREKLHSIIDKEQEQKQDELMLETVCFFETMKYYDAKIHDKIFDSFDHKALRDIFKESIKAFCKEYMKGVDRKKGAIIDKYIEKMEKGQTQESAKKIALITGKDLLAKFNIFPYEATFKLNDSKWIQRSVAHIEEFKTLYGDTFGDTMQSVYQHIGISGIDDSVLSADSVSGKWKDFMTESVKLIIGRRYALESIGDIGDSATTNAHTLALVTSEKLSPVVETAHHIELDGIAAIPFAFQDKFPTVTISIENLKDRKIKREMVFPGDKKITITYNGSHTTKTAVSEIVGCLERTPTTNYKRTQVVPLIIISNDDKFKLEATGFDISDDKHKDYLKLVIYNLKTDGDYGFLLVHYFKTLRYHVEGSRDPPRTLEKSFAYLLSMDEFSTFFNLFFGGRGQASFQFYPGGDVSIRIPYNPLDFIGKTKKEQADEMLAKQKKIFDDLKDDGKLLIEQGKSLIEETEPFDYYFDSLNPLIETIKDASKDETTLIFNLNSIISNSLKILLATRDEAYEDNFKRLKDKLENLTKALDELENLAKALKASAGPPDDSTAPPASKLLYRYRHTFKIIIASVKILSESKDFHDEILKYIFATSKLIESEFITTTPKVTLSGMVLRNAIELTPDAKLKDVAIRTRIKEYFERDTVSASELNAFPHNAVKIFRDAFIGIALENARYALKYSDRIQKIDSFANPYMLANLYRDKGVFLEDISNKVNLVSKYEYIKKRLLEWTADRSYKAFLDFFMNDLNYDRYTSGFLAVQMQMLSYNVNELRRAMNEAELNARIAEIKHQYETDDTVDEDDRFEPPDASILKAITQQRTLDPYQGNKDYEMIGKVIQEGELDIHALEPSTTGTGQNLITHFGTPAAHASQASSSQLSLASSATEESTYSSEFVSLSNMSTELLKEYLKLVSTADLLNAYLYKEDAMDVVADPSQSQSTSSVLATPAWASQPSVSRTSGVSSLSSRSVTKDQRTTFEQRLYKLQSKKRGLGSSLGLFSGSPSSKKGGKSIRIRFKNHISKYARKTKKYLRPKSLKKRSKNPNFSSTKKFISRYYK